MAQAKDEARFDFVVVGAGSAGCALAARLSEDPSVTVALLEAGPEDKALLLKMPSGSGNILPEKGPHNWGFSSAPQSHLMGRETYQPRGRGLGGSIFAVMRGISITGVSWALQGGAIAMCCPISAGRSAMNAFPTPIMEPKAL